MWSTCLFDVTAVFFGQGIQTGPFCVNFTAQVTDRSTFSMRDFNFSVASVQCRHVTGGN